MSTRRRDASQRSLRVERPATMLRREQQQSKPGRALGSCALRLGPIAFLEGPQPAHRAMTQQHCLDLRCRTRGSTMKAIVALRGFRRRPCPRSLPDRGSNSSACGFATIIAWLKAENWRDVLKDPAALPARHPGPSRGRERLRGRRPRATPAALRTSLVAEMRGRIKEDDSSVPEPDGPFAYYTRHREGGQHPLVCRQPRNGRRGTETSLLIDGDDAEATEGEGRFFDLARGDPFRRPSRLAWSADTKGSELFTIRVRDLATGEDLADDVAATSGEVVWARIRPAFYYVERRREPPPGPGHAPPRSARRGGGRARLRGDRVRLVRRSRRHPARPLPRSSTVSDHETSEVWLARPHGPGAPPRLVARARRRRATIRVEHHGERPRHPDQRRRRRGLQDRHRAARAPRPRQLARPRSRTGPA